MHTKKLLACAAFAIAAVGTDQILMRAQPPAAGADKKAPKKGGGGGGTRGPAVREMIYVTLPGTLEKPTDTNGNGIVVLDAHDDYNFVKRIPTWDVPASRNAEQVAGVTASTVTQMIYVAARGHLGAIDLATDKMAWSQTYDGNCCERPQIAPDGSFMYVGSDLKDFWYVINPKTGAMITKVVNPGQSNTHNLNFSADAKTAFMSPNGKTMAIADTTTNKLIKQITFPDNIRVFVLNHDSSLIYSNLNNLLGFVIADVKTGKILHTIEVQGFGWPENWHVTPRPRVPLGCPSHGIALVKDEKEVWLSDGLNDYIHIFDNTVMPPRQIYSFKTNGGAYWMTPSADRKLIYASSGDVIDIASRKIVGTLKDEYGRRLHSEKLLDMVFTEGKLTKVSNQFFNGFEDQEAPGKITASR